MNDAWNTVKDQLEGWGKAALEMLPSLAVAILVFLLFVILSRVARRTAEAPLGRLTHNEQLRGLALSVIRLSVLGLGVFIVLGILDLDGTVASLLAGVGVVGLALGFAFQDIAANFMSGVILAVRHPFQVGDTVEIADFNGTIERMDLRATIGRTFQGQIVTMPNKDVLGAHIKNFSTSGEWRVEIDVGISYGDDIDEAEAAVREALESITERAEGKPVDVWLTGFGDSSINMSARVWVDLNSQQSFLVTRHAIIKALKKTLDARGISIPFPIRTLDFDIKGGATLGDALGEREAA